MLRGEYVLLSLVLLMANFG